ncbi:hypothetical protein MKQ70_07240 [Chitinophaga sedimenti]|nr:hypothetical protein [Chitinophaga sedimenti]MCK7554807.1 hypothetical protein [Chitinophaga sedimenti]
MKRNIYALLAGSILFFSSCKKEWFETSPSGSLTGSEIYATTKTSMR